jgi:thiol:disulfide interchange protein
MLRRILSLGLPSAALGWLLVSSALAVDAQRMLEKYLRRVQSAGQDYVAGMQAPRRSPKQAALAAVGKYKNRTMEAIQQGRWEAGVQNYDEAAAIAAATSDGGAAYTAGIAKRQQKVATAFSRIAPQLTSISQTIQSMPQDTPEQRAQRMNRNLELMRGLGRQRRGGGISVG